MTNRSTNSILLAVVCIPLALNLYVGLVNSPIQKQQQKRSDNEYLLRAWNESDVSVSTQYPEWLNLSKCFQANTDIVVGSEFGRRFHRGKRRVSPDEIRKLSIPTRLLNVGMPKIGTSSLQALFMNSGKKFGNSYWQSRHHHCGRVGYCGLCMREAIEAGKPLMASCGNFTVWTQIDYPGHDCYWPQVSALKELYSEAPDAVFLLPFRNVTAWMQSLRKWDRIYTNMVGCELPKFPANSWNPNHFIDFYCDHVQSIRKFVYDHPTLTLIEFELNADVGEHLSSILEGIDASEWKRLNHGPRPQRKRRRGEGAN